jgi:hypothetical protein
LEKHSEELKSEVFNRRNSCKDFELKIEN